MAKLRVAFLFGGDSPEHEVSIITAIQAMAAARSQYDVIPVYVSKRGEIFTGTKLESIETYKDLPLVAKISERITLPTTTHSPVLTPIKKSLLSQSDKPFDILFPCFHGGVGEGGWIQGFAEQYHIPLVGTGLTGAALGMDKVTMRNTFAGAGITQAKYIWFYREEWRAQRKMISTKLATLAFPVFVKPSRGGSSIGTSKATDRQSLIHAVDLAASLDSRIIVEEGIENAREINISVMGNSGDELETSVCEEVFHGKSDFLGFEDKYLQGGKSQGMASTDRVIPADIPESVSQEVDKIARSVFRLCDCSGLVRIDFLIKGKMIYCVEVNTIPGSLSFYLWDKSGYTYPQLIDKLIAYAQSRYSENEKKVTNFSSNILENFSTQAAGKLGAKLKA